VNQKMRKISIIAIATSAISLAFAGAAFADVPIFGTIGNTITWNGSTLTVTGSGNAFTSEGEPYFAGVVGPVSTSITFSAGTLTTSGSSFTQGLGAGVFTITTGSGVISGTIASGASFSGSTTGSATFAWNPVAGDVTYNSTPLFSGKGLSTIDGNFSLEGISVEPSPFTISHGVLSGFSATDGSTFSANPTTTPEPASVATFGIGAMALMLLAGLARRRNANSTL
jgi:hypothetical protein